MGKCFSMCLPVYPSTHIHPPTLKSARLLVWSHHMNYSRWIVFSQWSHNELLSQMTFGVCFSLYVRVVFFFTLGCWPVKFWNTHWTWKQKTCCLCLYLTLKKPMQPFVTMPQAFKLAKSVSSYLHYGWTRYGVTKTEMRENDIAFFCSICERKK